MTLLSRNSILGLAAFVVGVSVYYAVSDDQRPTTESWSLRVDEPNRQIEPLPVGSSVELQYRIVNPGSRALRVVGFSSGCGPNWCFGTKHDLPIEVAPHDEIIFVVDLALKRAGEFVAETEIYLEHPHGINTVSLRVTGMVVGTKSRGVGISPEGNPDAPDNKP